MGDVLARTSEGTSGDNQSTVIRASGAHGIVRMRRHHSTVDIVGIVLEVSATLHDVRVGCAISESWACTVLNHVRRADKLAVRKTLALIGSATRACLLAVLPAGILVGEVILVVARAPVACTEITAQGRASVVLFSSNHGTLARCAGIRVLGLQACREAGNRSVRTISHRRGSWRIAIHSSKVLGCCVVSRVGSVVEVGRLVHVNPQGINVGTIGSIEECQKSFRPVLLGVGVKPVGEVTRASPDDTIVKRSVVLFHEDIVFETRVQCRIGLFVEHSRVNHNDVVLVPSVDSVDEILVKVGRESLRVNSEDTTTIHVVNVCPDGFQRDIVGRVIGSDGSNLVNILVSILALMESKSPVGGHQGKLCDLSVLSSHIARGRAGNEVEIENTADDVVLKVLATLVVDVNVHSV